MCRYSTECNAHHVESGSASTVQLVDGSNAYAASGTGHAGSGAERANSETGTGTGLSRTGTITKHSDADADFDLHDSTQPGGTRQISREFAGRPVEVAPEFGRATRS